MKYVVSCPQCPSPIAVCRNEPSAVLVKQRHDRLRGHDSTVTRELDTPLEGLL